MNPHFKRTVMGVVAASVTSVLAGVGIAAAMGAPTLTPPAARPAPAVVTTQPAAEPTHLAPRCFETSVNGTQDCAWVPVAECLSDEAGDDAIPQSYDGCYWDAASSGNGRGASYVIWRGGRG